VAKPRSGPRAARTEPPQHATRPRDPRAGHAHLRRLFYRKKSRRLEAALHTAAEFPRKRPKYRKKSAAASDRLLVAGANCTLGGADAFLNWTYAFDRHHGEAPVVAVIGILPLIGVLQESVITDVIQRVGTFERRGDGDRDREAFVGMKREIRPCRPPVFGSCGSTRRGSRHPDSVKSMQTPIC
jgi:hypothetical protein